MTDVNTTTVRPPDPVDFDNQTRGTQTLRPRMPAQGEYTLLLTAIDQEGQAGRTREGYRQATLTFKVVDPGTAHDNYEIKYQRVNTKKWASKESNSMLDLLRANGITSRPTTDAEYDQLIQACLNRPVRAVIDWRAFDKAAQKEHKGMEAFPKRADGSYQPWVISPGGGDTKVFANVDVKFFKDAVAR